MIDPSEVAEMPRDVQAIAMQKVEHLNRLPSESCFKTDNSIRFDLQTGRKEEDRIVLDQPSGMKIETQFGPSDRQLHHLDFSKTAPKDDVRYRLAGLSRILSA